MPTEPFWHLMHNETNGSWFLLLDHGTNSWIGRLESSNGVVEITPMIDGVFVGKPAGHEIHTKTPTDFTWIGLIVVALLIGYVTNRVAKLSKQ